MADSRDVSVALHWKTDIWRNQYTRVVLAVADSRDMSAALYCKADAWRNQHTRVVPAVAL